MLSRQALSGFFPPKPTNDDRSLFSFSSKRSLPDQQ